MAISDELVGKNGDERARIKAQRLVEYVQSYIPHTYSYSRELEEYTITLKAASYDPTRGILSFNDVTATKNGTDIPLETPLEYFNPPILVVTGRKGNGDLVTKEDPLESIKQMVGRTIEIQGRGR